MARHAPVVTFALSAQPTSTMHCHVPNVHPNASMVLPIATAVFSVLRLLSTKVTSTFNQATWRCLHLAKLCQTTTHVTYESYIYLQPSDMAMPTSGEALSTHTP